MKLTCCYNSCLRILGINSKGFRFVDLKCQRGNSKFEAFPDCYFLSPTTLLSITDMAGVVHQVPMTQSPVSLSVIQESLETELLMVLDKIVDSCAQSHISFVL